MSLQTLVNCRENIQVPNDWAIEPGAAHALCWGEETGVGEGSEHNILKVGVKGISVILESSGEYVSQTDIDESLHLSNIS